MTMITIHSEAVDAAAVPPSTRTEARRPRARGVRRELDQWSDGDLARAVRAGSSAAADTLYARHERIVRFVVRDNVRDLDEIDDVVQEIFGRAFGRLDALRDPARFRAWLLQIARRAAIDARRARGRRPELQPIDDHVVIDLTPGPGLVAEVRDLATAIGRGLDDLSPRDRTVLTMVTELNFTTDEVAAALELTPGAAKVVLHRARKRLRAMVDPVLVEAASVPTG